MLKRREEASEVMNMDVPLDDEVSKTMSTESNGESKSKSLRATTGRHGRLVVVTRQSSEEYYHPKKDGGSQKKSPPKRGAGMRSMKKKEEEIVYEINDEMPILPPGLDTNAEHPDNRFAEASGLGARFVLGGHFWSGGESTSSYICRVLAYIPKGTDLAAYRCQGIANPPESDDDIAAEALYLFKVECDRFGFRDHESDAHHVYLVSERLVAAHLLTWSHPVLDDICRDLHSSSLTGSDHDRVRRAIFFVDGTMIPQSSSQLRSCLQGLNKLKVTPSFLASSQSTTPAPTKIKRGPGLTPTNPNVATNNNTMSDKKSAESSPFTKGTAAAKSLLALASLASARSDRANSARPKGSSTATAKRDAYLANNSQTTLLYCHSLRATTTDTGLVGRRLNDNSGLKKSESRAQRAQQDKQGRWNATSFPRKLQEIVRDSANVAAIYWDASIKSLCICDVQLFTLEVFPKYFKVRGADEYHPGDDIVKCRLQSFRRQLSNYGFHMSQKRSRNFVIYANRDPNIATSYHFSRLRRHHQERPNRRKKVKLSSTEANTTAPGAISYHQYLPSLDDIEESSDDDIDDDNYESCA